MQRGLPQPAAGRGCTKAESGAGSRVPAPCLPAWGGRGQARALCAQAVPVPICLWAGRLGDSPQLRPARCSKRRLCCRSVSSHCWLPPPFFLSFFLFFSPPPPLSPFLSLSSLCLSSFPSTFPVFFSFPARLSSDNFYTHTNPPPQRKLPRSRFWQHFPSTVVSPASAPASLRHGRLCGPGGCAGRGFGEGRLVSTTKQRLETHQQRTWRGPSARCESRR